MIGETEEVDLMLREEIVVGEVEAIFGGVNKMLVTKSGAGGSTFLVKTKGDLCWLDGFTELWVPICHLTLYELHV